MVHIQGTEDKLSHMKALTNPEKLAIACQWQS